MLSPARNEPFPFDAILTEAVENLNICLSSPFHTGRETEFLETKDAFVRLYMQCQTAFAPSDRATPGRRRILLDSLRDLLGRMEDMRSDLAHSPATPDIQDILNQSVVRNVYTETQNDLSLVFHNRRSRGPSNLDILMTGDVSDEVLRRISNGDYHAGGAISQRYIDMECIKHCTNAGACRWRDIAGGCCNRLQRCYEQPASGSLTLKCAAAAGERRTPCNIYVFGHSGVLGCHCDRG